MGNAQDVKTIEITNWKKKAQKKMEDKRSTKKRHYNWRHAGEEVYG